jgi:ribonuclease III
LRFYRYFLLVYYYIFFKDRNFYNYIRRSIGRPPYSMSHYIIAFSHSSSTDVHMHSNERLELLGDSILGAVVSDYLYKKYPTQDEGFLTSLKSKIVNRAHLNKIGQRLQLDKYLVRKGSQRMHRNDLYGNTFEAFVGAIYLDIGYDGTKRYILNKIIRSYVNLDELEIEVDFKSELFIFTQKKGQKLEYRVLSENKIQNRNYYEIELWIDDVMICKGEGFSKKVAETEASRKAKDLIELNEV